MVLSAVAALVAVDVDVLAAVAVVALIVIFQEAQRRIPVQYARSQFRGGRLYRQQGQSHIPLRVNSAGMIPLILASGAGARSRFDIGLVIAMGMAVGTLFTLFITPAVYTFIARDHSHDREKEAGVAVAGKPAAAEPRAAE